MITFIFQHKLSILNFINLFIWLYFYNNKNMTGLNKFVVRYFIYFLAIYTFWDVMMILSEHSGNIYLFFWTAISIYELYFIITVLFKLAGWDYIWLAVSIPALPIFLGAIFSYYYGSYQPVNVVEFFNALIILIFSVLVLRYLLIKEEFAENLESFFIFSGFILYFFLQILATNIMSFNFLKHWYFSEISTLLVQYFWFGSILCIQRVKYKYSL